MNRKQRKEELRTLRDNELLAYNSLCRMNTFLISDDREYNDRDRVLTFEIIKERNLSPRYPDRLTTQERKLYL